MSWVQYSPDSHFPIQNLPYGIFRRKQNVASNFARVGVAIGDQVLDLAAISDAGFFTGSLQNTNVFHQPTLNAFMNLGRSSWKEARAVITRLLSKDEGALRDNQELRAKALVPQSEVEMLLPAQIGDYTDFYASKEHATNIGTMWRGKENALMPNWLHIPIGYHGRASSVVVSGTNIRRPRGQTRPNDQQPPVFGPCKVLDLELEMGWFIGPGNNMGDPLKISNVEDHLFGMVLLNDWSARDIQKWEYQPLGPFCAKNFATTISPWVVTFEALEPFRVQGPAQDPSPLPYLADNTPSAYDINLFSYIQSEKMTKPQQICQTNYKYMYWTMKQQTVHHTSTGCNMRPGDLLGSGTISGPTPDSYGSLLEITWGGSKTFELAESKEERKYIQDGDTIILTGYCQGADYRIGFGECSGKIIPAHTD